MALAPIVLFTYNRPWHLMQTVSALLKNFLASESEIFIFSDGPKDENDEAKVAEVRKYIKTIKGFKRIEIIERDKNWGLANNIIDGITKVVNQYGKVVVLEDDLVTSPYFLKFMNDGLNMYEEEEKVISVHGYVYPIKGLPEIFFLRGADCWGWATWKRGWDLFEKDGKKLLDELEKRKLTKLFDFNGAYPYTKMLKDQVEGKVDSWAIRWYASAFIHEKLTLYPGISLVKHIGDLGIHIKGNSWWLDFELSEKPIFVKRIPPIEDPEVRKKIEDFFFRIKRKRKISDLLKQPEKLIKRFLSRFIELWK
ncbi:MAG: glycosyltransferase [Candidatus Calescibacterium sp.]